MTTEHPTPRPPRFAHVLLRALFHPADRECALSDLSEEFERRHAQHGRLAARHWYRQQAITSVWPTVKRRLRKDESMPHTHSDRGGGVVTELRWAWRGVRGRRWRAMFVVLLLGVALAANAIVFAAADAFVFRVVPYREPGRLAVIETIRQGASDYIQPPKLRAWREHRDLFADIQVHVRDASAYITTAGITDVVRAERVTPGLFEMLGVIPRWGRPFTAVDATTSDPLVAIIGEAFAKRLFGDAGSAVGRTFFTGRDTLTVVGVMPASFRFPTAVEEIWRPLDLSTWPDNSGLRDIARLAPGQTIATAARAVADRSEAVERSGERRVVGESLRLRSMAEVRGNAGAATIFAMLVGASACLLLIACANVASLEMAAAAARMRVYAIQAALGASRASLVRAGILEGGLLLGASAAVAISLSILGTRVLVNQLTPAMRDALTSPLAVNGRVMAVMLIVATATWLATSLPAIWRVSRLSVVDGLRDDPRTMPVTRAAARSRQLLMASQVALTTLLLVGALLYLRTYLARTGVDKGFDASNIATIEVFPAPDAGRKAADLESELLTRLRATPGVRAVSQVDSLPPATDSGVTARLTVDGREITSESLMLHFVSAAPEYFNTMNISIVQGSAFDATTPPDQVVVDERFARAYWPGASALGARFSMQNAGIAGIRSFQIAGISRQLEADRLQKDSGEQVYQAYIRLSPTYKPLTFVARLGDEQRLTELGPLVRSIAPRSVVRIDTVAARYARLSGDTRLAASITTGFGVIALIVATSGIYAVLAFLVAGRSKEIAIRMALGADRWSVRKLILNSSLRFIGAGLLTGVVAALLASHWIAAQLFGVTATDPATYASVSLLIVGTALAATWWPARRAARVDPAVTLRTQ